MLKLCKSTGTTQASALFENQFLARIFNCLATTTTSEEGVKLTARARCFTQEVFLLPPTLT